jgi:hypothetical protein
VVYLGAINLSWYLLAVLFDAREVASSLWAGLPLGILLLAVVEITFDLRVPRWVKKWKLPMMVFWGLFGLALVVWVTSGIWWMAIPIVAILTTIYVHRAVSAFSGRRGNQAAP